VTNTSIKNSRYGIVVGYGATATVTNTTMTGIVYEGLEIRGGISGTTTVYATDTTVSCEAPSDGYAFDNYPPTGTVGRMFLTRVTAANCLYGIVNEPDAASVNNVIAVSNSMATGNGYGVYNTTVNTFLSSGANHVANNGTDTSGTITAGPMLH
jgi:hypothetical protein